MRTLATAAGMLTLVLAVLLAAVGQLGKIDRQTLVVVLAGAAIAALVATAMQRRKDVHRITSRPPASGRLSRSARRRGRADAPPRLHGPSTEQW
jgi:Na+/H+ antiporter NhaD/arsenite permease-like protein